MAAKHGGFTDPLHPEDRIDKWMPSETDRIDKWAPSQTDKIKYSPSQTDQIPGRALNPQPLPPGFQDETTFQIPRDFPPSQAGDKPMWGVGRGLRSPVGIILVVVLVLVLLAGGLILSHQGSSQSVPLSSPGVYAWEDSTTLGQSSTGLTTPCKGTLASGIVQQLIGGGYTLSRSQAPATADPVVPYSSTRKLIESWDTSFVPGAGGAQLINYAICLREPASFFGGSTVQYEPSAMTTLTNPGPLAIKADCPAGMSVLGGGYVVQPYRQGEAPPTIDSSFPYASASGAGWGIVANSVNGLDQAQAWAVCSGALHTHLESASVPNNGVFRSTITCAQGTLLGGGFDLLQPRGDNYFSTDYARQDSPGQTLHQDAVQGDTFSDWRVIGELNGVGSHYTATLWAVCWDQNGSPPVTAPTVAATTAPTQAPTAAPTVAPTATPVAAPTATPVPQPTKTPTPTSCSVAYSGNVQLSTTASEYVNLDNGTTSNSSDATIQWIPSGTIPGAFTAENGALLSGPPLASQTCDYLKTLTYNETTIKYAGSPITFAVKLKDGHYAEVTATTHLGIQGGNYTTIAWTTYYP